MVRWEYMTVSHAYKSLKGWEWEQSGFEEVRTADVLQAFGSQGWELVTAVPYHESYDEGRSATNLVEYIFKRPSA